MVQFRDLKNLEKNSKPGDKGKKEVPSGPDTRLSFRKLIAEQKTIVEDRSAPDKEIAAESGKKLYQNASAYLKEVLAAVRQRKKFSLEPGFKIVREMVDVKAFQDLLFIEALHFDDSLEFIINNNVNVAIYAVKMAENLGWDRSRQIEIGMAGLLHDIGMGLIPEKLLFKQQRLSDEEFKIFKQRSNYSYKILKTFEDEYSYLAECAIQVNERINGSGYPQGLKGDEIHEYAQVIGLVDMYEALIHSRPQREKFHHFIAVKEIIKSGKNLFQRRHLKALLNIFSIFPLQSYVRLNSDAIGRVVQTYPDLPMRPKIQIIFDSQQKRVLTERIVNLPDDPLLYIVDTVFEEELDRIEDGGNGEKRRPGRGADKADPADSDKTAAVADEDKPEAAKVPKEKRPVFEGEPAPKASRLKIGLFAAAMILLLAGILVQFGVEDSKRTDVGRPVEPSAKEVEPATEPTPPAAPVKAVSKQEAQAENPAEPRSFVSEAGDVVEEKAGAGTGRLPSPGAGAADSGEALRTGKTRTPAVTAPVEALAQAPAAASAKAKPEKVSYPYSIKLDAVRTLEELEAALEGYREKGLSPFWAKVDLADQGVWYRIFTGCFQNRGQAEEMIKALGLTTEKAKMTKFANLTGTYTSEMDVNSQMRFLTGKGFSPYVIEGDGGEYFVYVGAFYTRKGAEDQQAELLAQGVRGDIAER